MISLDLTTDTLEGDMDAAGADVIYYVVFKDNYGDDRPQRTAKQITPSNGTTAVQICSAPGLAPSTTGSGIASITREIQLINVYNGNAATRIVLVSINANTTIRTLVQQSLTTLQTLQWTPTSGWSVI